MKHFGRAGFMDEIAAETDVIATTRRDKLRTAASWGNRKRLIPGVSLETWHRSWRDYDRFMREVKPELIFDTPGDVVQNGIRMLGPENEMPDRFGLHAALDEGDYEHFLKYVPLECVEDCLASLSR